MSEEAVKPPSQHHASPHREFNRGPTQGSELWSFPILGCFQDFRICCVTFIFPCYTYGRNAEHFNDDCMILGFMYFLGLGPALGPVLRWRIRQEKNIVGSMMYDVLVHAFCPCCALIQENREIFSTDPDEHMPIMPEIKRH